MEMIEKKELITKDTLFVKDEEGQMILAPNAIETIREIELQVKKLNMMHKKYKEVLLDGMESYGIRKIDTDDLLITYIEPTERVGIDQEKLWKEYRNVAFKCQKETPVKASIRITPR